MAHKFNVGDRVKLQKGLADGGTYAGNGEGEYYNLIFFGDVMGFDGARAIEAIDEDGDYRLDGMTNSECWYADTMLEAADPEPTEFHVGDVVQVNQEVTLSDIINGAGEPQVVFSFLNHACTNYRNDKPCDFGRNRVIEKVDAEKHTVTIKSLSDKRFTLPSSLFYLVKAVPQPKEMTMAELEKALGYPVKIVKGDTE